MKLLNPLFDTVFKYLMEDLDVAKSIIESIIKSEVIELSPAPQESTSVQLKIKYAQMEIHRQDYVAIIKTRDNSGIDTTEKVVIEVQKSPFIPEIGRFRNYLADKYRRKSVFTDKDGQQDKYLSIKTIYLIEEVFNKNLPAVLGRRGKYINELDNSEYNGKRDEIVELFNHDSWFIQTELLPPEFKDELMYVLSVFTPFYRKKTSDRYIEIPDEKLLIQKHKILERLIRRLEAATGNEEINKAVDLEIEYESYIERKIAETEQANTKVALAEAKAEQERKEKEQERAEKESFIEKMVLKFHNKNFTVKEISDEVEISEDKIREILKKNNL